MATLQLTDSKTSAATLLTTEQAAEILGIEPTTLTTWRSTGRYAIPFVRVGRAVRYRRADLDAWLRSRTVNGSEQN